MAPAPVGLTVHRRPRSLWAAQAQPAHVCGVAVGPQPDSRGSPRSLLPTSPPQLLNRANPACPGLQLARGCGCRGRGRPAQTPQSPQTRVWRWGTGNRHPAASLKRTNRLTVRPLRCQPGKREQRGFPGAQVGRRVSREFRAIARARLHQEAPPLSGRIWLPPRWEGVS